MRLLRLSGDGALPGAAGPVARVLRRLLGGDAPRRARLLAGGATTSASERAPPREDASSAPATPGDRWFAQI